MTNWNALLRQNPEPTLLDAIDYAERNPEYRVRIIQDSCPEDPRDGFDLMCEINWVTSAASAEDHIVDLIQRSDGYAAAMQLIAAATPEDEELREPDLWNREVRDQWLDVLKDELIVEEFSTGGRGCEYVAHTTPEMCDKLGVDWANAEKAMAGEIEMFKQWADGDVYGFVLEKRDTCPTCAHTEWEEVDSCWGFYGDDPFENGMSDHIDKQHHWLLKKAEVEYR